MLKDLYAYVTVTLAEMSGSALALRRLCLSPGVINDVDLPVAML
jgi:hypothetical protein